MNRAPPYVIVVVDGLATHLVSDIFGELLYVLDGASAFPSSDIASAMMMARSTNPWPLDMRSQLS
jgi:hypothetical protein